MSGNSAGNGLDDGSAVALPRFNFQAVSNTKVKCDICGIELTLRMGQSGCSGRAHYVLTRHVLGIHRIEKCEVSIHNDVIVRPKPRVFVGRVAKPREVSLRTPARKFEGVSAEKEKMILEAREREARERREQPKEPMAEPVPMNDEELKEARRRRQVHMRYLRKVKKDMLAQSDPSKAAKKKKPAVAKKKLARVREVENQSYHDPPLGILYPDFRERKHTDQHGNTYTVL